MSIQIVLVFLATAGVVVPLANRLRVSPVLVFLVAGAVLGPTGLGRLIGPEDFLAHFLMPPGEGVAVLAEFGVVFLMFLIGLDLSPGRLWALRRLVFGLGTAQVVVGALAIGLIAYSFGNSPLASLVLGVCLAFSSTAIVLPVLSETGRAASTLGRAALAVLLLQDIAVVPALLLVDFGDIADGAGSDTAYRLLVSVAEAGVAIGAIVIAGHFIARPLLRIVAQSKSPEFFAAFVLLAAIGTALVTEKAGLPMTLGAFLAGLLLAESEYRHEISVAMAPFKGLLLGVFFMSVGLRVDLAAFVADPFWMIASVIGLIVLKAALILPL
ncbi:MAG: sodium:proton exchanger, partial [Alphaproteobacteria bacterium]|nr:sodium:proton exchanger [Alphaproteobacteria bacterium]